MKHKKFFNLEVAEDWLHFNKTLIKIYGNVKLINCVQVVN